MTDTIIARDALESDPIRLEDAPNTVRLTAFSREGNRIPIGVYGIDHLYGARIALVDDPDERQRRDVGKIVATQYGSDGRLEVVWTLYYGFDGRVAEAFERRGQRAAGIDLRSLLRQRFRWVSG